MNSTCLYILYIQKGRERENRCCDCIWWKSVYVRQSAVAATAVLLCSGHEVRSIYVYRLTIYAVATIGSNKMIVLYWFGFAFIRSGKKKYYERALNMCAVLYIVTYTSEEIKLLLLHRFKQCIIYTFGKFYSPVHPNTWTFFRPKWTTKSTYKYESVSEWVVSFQLRFFGFRIFCHSHRHHLRNS